MNHKFISNKSVMSLSNSRLVSATSGSKPRPSRNCSNCTCSPGLLSRQNRRASLMAKRMNLRKASPGNVHSLSGLSRSMSRISIAGSESNCGTGLKEMNTSYRLQALRHQMKQNDISIYVVPSEDEHMSEYVSLKDQRRSFISGFSGSSGIAIITVDLLSMNDVPTGMSVLSTDGRYFIQAENELDFNWKLLKQGTDLSWDDWTISNAIQSSLDSGLTIKIGINPKLITFNNFLNFEKKLNASIKKANSKIKNPKNHCKVEIVPVDKDFIDAIWSKFENIQEVSYSRLIKVDESMCGESTDSKIKKMRNSIKNKYGNENLILSSLDEIAWLLNLRGFDIQYNPVFYSYFISHNDGRNILYCDMKQRFEEKDDSIYNYLKDNNVEVVPYEQFYSDIAQIGKSKENFCITNTANWLIGSSILNATTINSPVELLKSVKNEVEIKNFKIAHNKDGLANIKFFAWLSNEIITNGELVSEFEAAQKQEQFRKAQENYVELSFETISSTGKNAAIIHYSPSVEVSSIINPSKIYLNDSGAQYLEGTTDVTRTFHFDEPSEEEQTNYTLVLKGNLAIENLKFPEGTTGIMIDCIARQFLWSKGLDYKHGTSHGIGYFLNVHEGPIGIGYKPQYMNHALEAGNVISNEPGYYKEGDYGIRIENVIVVVEDDEINKRDVSDVADKKFLKFENITKVPYCRKLINADILSSEEILKINEYHAAIYNEYKTQLEDDPLTLTWLKNECLPL